MTGTASEGTAAGWSTETVEGPSGLVCSVDRQASDAGATVLARGGNAVDAAVATSAALAVTTPHMCGMGGDLFAIVHGPVTGAVDPLVLNASGRAGSGADLGKLRAEGHTAMPFRGDVRSAPVPGCVDGWLALHSRLGQLRLAEVLGPAIELAEVGFEVSPLLAFMLPGLAGVTGCDELVAVDVRTGDRLLRPGPARLLRAVANDGRDGFYGGEFGEHLLEVGAGEFAPEDLALPMADWVDGLALDVWGHRLWTVPPNSQGYLSLAAAAIAEAIGTPQRTATDIWAHVTIESARLAGHDRPAVLHEHADGPALLARGRLRALVARFDAERTTDLHDHYRDGGTIYLCAADAAGNGVSLIQSNASGFGSHVAVPGTGVLLHNRGIGFSLEPGHPAAYGPGRRPPHTLAPALVTRADGTLRAVLGTMGGDSQPQVVLQMLARLLVAGQSPAGVISAPRWALTTPGGSGFDLWDRLDEHRVRLEGHAPDAWSTGLRQRGHRVEVAGRDVAGFGHAHLIDFGGGSLAGAADPRALVGAAVAAPL